MGTMLSALTILGNLEKDFAGCTVLHKDHRVPLLHHLLGDEGSISTGTLIQEYRKTGFPGGSVVKNPPANADGGLITGWEDPLEKEMATHSSILAWEIPRTEAPGGLQSMGSEKSWTQLSDETTTTTT